MRGEPAGDRFVIVGDGQDSLWRRVRREIEPSERNVAWMPFGVKPTIADCFDVWLIGREIYGANYNRVTFELAQVPAFARWLKSRPADLCNYVSNSCARALSIEPYSEAATTRLRNLIEGPRS